MDPSSILQSVGARNDEFRRILHAPAVRARKTFETAGSSPFNSMHSEDLWLSAVASNSVDESDGDSTRSKKVIISAASHLANNSEQESDPTSLSFHNQYISKLANYGSQWCEDKPFDEESIKQKSDEGEEWEAVFESKMFRESTQVVPAAEKGKRIVSLSPAPSERSPSPKQTLEQSLEAKYPHRDSCPAENTKHARIDSRIRWMSPPTKSRDPSFAEEKEEVKVPHDVGVLVIPAPNIPMDTHIPAELNVDVEAPSVPKKRRNFEGLGKEVFAQIQKRQNRRVCLAILSILCFLLSVGIISGVIGYYWEET